MGFSEAGPKAVAVRWPMQTIEDSPRPTHHALCQYMYIFCKTTDSYNLVQIRWLRNKKKNLLGHDRQLQPGANPVTVKQNKKKQIGEQHSHVIGRSLIKTRIRLFIIT